MARPTYNIERSGFLPQKGLDFTDVHKNLLRLEEGDQITIGVDSSEYEFTVFFAGSDFTRVLGGFNVGSQSRVVKASDHRQALINAVGHFNHGRGCKYYVSGYDGEVTLKAFEIKECRPSETMDFRGADDYAPAYGYKVVQIDA